MNEIMRYDLDRDTDEGCADMVPISDGRYVEFEDLERIISEHDSQPQPDSGLCKFYDVTDWSGLVRELVRHVAQLQDSAKRNVKPWEDTFPPTLLPAYIERVNIESAAAQHQENPVAVVPELTSELRWILGQMCFQHIHTAQALRLMGHQIARKAEDEQAVTIYWMLGHYLKDTANWRQNAIAELKAAAPAS